MKQIRIPLFKEIIACVPTFKLLELVKLSTQMKAVIAKELRKKRVKIHSSTELPVRFIEEFKLENVVISPSSLLEGAKLDEHVDKVIANIERSKGNVEYMDKLTNNSEGKYSKIRRLNELDIEGDNPVKAESITNCKKISIEEGNLDCLDCISNLNSIEEVVLDCHNSDLNRLSKLKRLFSLEIDYFRTLNFASSSLRNLYLYEGSYLQNSFSAPNLKYLTIIHTEISTKTIETIKEFDLVFLEIANPTVSIDISDALTPNLRSLILYFDTTA